MIYKVEYDLDDGRGVQSFYTSEIRGFEGMKHEELAELIQGNGLSLDEVAAGIGISKKALYRKLCGKEGFSWNQVCALQQKYFPDLTKEDIMREHS